MRFAVLFCAIFLMNLTVYAGANYRGYSGAPGRQSCAASCHGSGTGTVTVTGFPTEYTPGQSYLITVRKTSGSTISNFNASCRAGSGSTNGGVIAAGTGTSTYNVSNETNGIHLTSANRDSGTFHWTAPAAGTGEVRLYVAAHQGNYGGANTTITRTAQEAAASAPNPATNPTPSDAAMNIALNAVLSWSAGSGAISHIVRIGLTSEPDSVATITTASYDPPANLQPSTHYYWRIDERNTAGITPGSVWSFTTVPALPNAATNPAPQNNATEVALNTLLSWTSDIAAVSHDVYLGLTNPPALISSAQSGSSYTPLQDLLADTVYYWRVNERNAAGLTTGTLWSFRTVVPNGVQDGNPFLPTAMSLGPVYPNPFNAVVTIGFELPQASDVRLALYDIHGRLVGKITGGVFAAGAHRVMWSAEHVGSGIYFARLSAGSMTLTTKVVAIK